MVKNQNGGNKGKKMGRKFLSTPVDKRIRLAEEDGEIYGVVTKLLGNGMFYVNDIDGKERQVVMRNKFRGKGKRDNSVIQGGWVLIGEREFESCVKPKHDLLEVYNDSEKNKMKNSGNPIFARLRSEYDNKKIDDDDDNDDDVSFGFSNKNTTDYNSQLENIMNSTEKGGETISMDTGEEIDVDDI